MQLFLLQFPNFFFDNFSANSLIIYIILHSISDRSEQNFRWRFSMLKQFCMIIGAIDTTGLPGNRCNLIRIW